MKICKKQYQWASSLGCLAQHVCLFSIFVFLVYFLEFVPHHLDESRKFLELLHVLNIFVAFGVDQSHRLLVFSDRIVEGSSLLFLDYWALKLVQPAIYSFWLIGVKLSIRLKALFVKALVIFGNIRYAWDVICMFNSSMQWNSFCINVNGAFCNWRLRSNLALWQVLIQSIAIVF